MDSGKIERKREIIRELASKFILQENSGASMITVTRIETDGSAKYVTVLFSVLPESKEKSASEFLMRKRSDFRIYVSNNSRLNPLPIFDFKIDIGEKNRQRIDEIDNAMKSDS